MLRVLDLFSGIGGFSLGLERTGGFETVAFCEIEEFPRKVLAKHWPGVPIFEDVTKLRGEDVGSVDVICGGYPCQPFSVAGQRQGQADDRHLWPEMYRLVDELMPTWVIGENVAGHVSMGLDDVLSDLEAIDYTARTFVIPACAVDARHRRDRCWIVAHTARFQSGRQEQRPVGERVGQGGEPIISDADQQRGDRSATEYRKNWWEKSSRSNNVSDNGRRRSEGPRSEIGRQSPSARWVPEPNVGRVANGVSNRVDRLKALGNAVVPQVVEMIGRAILEAEAGKNHETRDLL